MGLVDRGVRRARFVVLREAEMPAVLIEAGFMSHPEEMRRIQDPAYRRQTAQAARNTLNRQKKQSFAEAIKKSTMSKEEKKEWLV